MDFCATQGLLPPCRGEMPITKGALICTVRGRWPPERSNPTLPCGAPWILDVGLLDAVSVSGLVLGLYVVLDVVLDVVRGPVRGVCNRRTVLRGVVLYCVVGAVLCCAACVAGIPNTRPDRIG